MGKDEEKRVSNGINDNYKKIREDLQKEIAKREVEKVKSMQTMRTKGNYLDGKKTNLSYKTSNGKPNNNYKEINKKNNNYSQNKRNNNPSYSKNNYYKKNNNQPVIKQNIAPKKEIKKDEIKSIPKEEELEFKELLEELEQDDIKKVQDKKRDLPKEVFIEELKDSDNLSVKEYNKIKEKDKENIIIEETLDLKNENQEQENQKAQEEPKIEIDDTIDINLARSKRNLKSLEEFEPKKKTDVKENKHKKKRKKGKRKLKKWVYVILIVFLLSILFGVYYFYNEHEKSLKREKEQQEKAKLDEIKSHFNEVVKTSKDTPIYQKEDNKFTEVGSVYQDVTLLLSSDDIKLDTKYFQIKDSDYYIPYDSVIKSDMEEKIDERYKKYIPFNENIVTKDKFTLYQEDTPQYSFNSSMEFPIIINNYENKYYIEYNNKLLNIKKEDVEKTVKANNTTKKNQSRITTFAYHRVYDTNEKCTDSYICIKKSAFDEEMKYLADNNYMTLTLTELYMYLKGSLQVEKAVVLTFDDGYLITSAIDVLEKYGLNGTAFVISAWFDDLSVFKSDNLEVQSHTHSMHKNYVCPGGNQGGKMLCASEKDIKDDLQKSIEKLGTDPIALAFPFYDYNDKAIKVLKEVGFKMSFIGRGGVLGRATPKVTDPYKVPRLTVYDSNLMSFTKWKGYI